MRSMLQGDEIVIEVEDDGCGIPAEKIARIFGRGTPDDDPCTGGPVRAVSF